MRNKIDKLLKELEKSKTKIMNRWIPLLYSSNNNKKLSFVESCPNDRFTTWYENSDFKLTQNHSHGNFRQVMDLIYFRNSMWNPESLRNMKKMTSKNSRVQDTFYFVGEKCDSHIIRPEVRSKYYLYRVIKRSVKTRKEIMSINTKLNLLVI